MKKILIGSHVSVKAPNFFLGAVKEAISYNSTTFMFYTGAPQNTIRQDTAKMKIEEGLELIANSDIELSTVVAHAPYIINLGNTTNPATYELAKSFLVKELQRVSDFKVKTVVLHPGAHVGAGYEAAITQIIEGLNFVLDANTTGVTIALETMAGKGSEVGVTFEQIRQIIDGVNNKAQIGVCLDTCHINDAGYNVSDVDQLISEFDRIIGLDYLKVVHINDSKNEIGAHKDRHENIGYGTIGFDVIKAFVHHPKLENIPKILETPYINKEIPPYKDEIAMLTSGNYIPNWRDNI